VRTRPKIRGARFAISLICNSQSEAHHVCVSRNLTAIAVAAAIIPSDETAVFAEGGGLVDGPAASGAWREHHSSRSTEFHGGPDIVVIDGSSYHGGDYGDCGIFDVIYDRSGRVIGQQPAC
jgi:hypothetical protein